MSDKTPDTFLTWLGLRTPPDWTKAKWLGKLLSVVTILLLLLALLAAFKALIAAVFMGGETASLGFGALVVAVLGAPFVIWRTIVAQNQADVARENLITDRLNKAVEGLGAINPTDNNNPNLEVRIGAIYALERISKYNAQDHVNIMEILCAYIRQNAGRGAPTLPEGDMTPTDWREWGETSRRHPPFDVDVALQVIERREGSRKALEKEAKYRPSLKRAPLQGLDLRGRDLAGFDLRETQLQGANLRDAELQGVDLSLAKLQMADLQRANLQGVRLKRTRLQGADLMEAQLQGATLWGAQLNRADLSQAQLQGANLRLTHLQRAILSEAHLQGADLRFVRLQGASLRAARLQGADLREAQFDAGTKLAAADLRGAAVWYVDLTDVRQITEHLPDMFGDGSVTLPKGETRPSHWPEEKLKWEDFKKKRHEWLQENHPDLL